MVRIAYLDDSKADKALFKKLLDMTSTGVTLCFPPVKPTAKETVKCLPTIDILMVDVTLGDFTLCELYKELLKTKDITEIMLVVVSGIEEADNHLSEDLNLNLYLKKPLTETDVNILFINYKSKHWKHDNTKEVAAIGV